MQPYKNPPIKEALLDIRVKLPAETTLGTLATFQDKIKGRFPIKEERVNWESGLQIKPGSVPEIIPPSGGAYGFFFRSETDKKIVQARRDGFTFNKLKPYDKWEIFCAEGKELWNHYLQVAKPVKVTRLAVRYINRIELPLPIKDFKEYLLTTPEIASGIPQGIAKFFMQAVIPKEDIGAAANITASDLTPRSAVAPLTWQ